MGNLCETLNNDILFYYIKNNTFNKSIYDRLYQKNTLIMSNENYTDIMITVRKLLHIVYQFSDIDKLNFFNKCINTTNHSLNISNIKYYFKLNKKLFDIYNSTVSVLHELTNKSNKFVRICSYTKNYDISDINFNFVLDSILLSLNHLIDSNLVDRVFNKCIYCYDNGYYNECGYYNNKDCYCKIHKMNNMKFIDNIDNISIEEDNCIFCMDSKRNLIFIPCGHIILCTICYQDNNFTKCCVCNQNISQTYKLYL